MTVLIIMLLLVALYLFLIAPNRPGKDFSRLLKVDYAHRGLHGQEADVPENSLAAFRKAVEAGYGIELDVQCTLDGVLAVFHDETLKRMCGEEKRLADCTMEELQTYALSETGERIPSFQAVLELVDGRVPLIVEIKPYQNVQSLAAAVFAALSRYKGPYCVESFHPLVLRWFKRNAPETIRGQLAMGGHAHKGHQIRDLVLKHMLLNAFSRPDFIAYDFSTDRNITMGLMRKLFKPTFVAWTVRSKTQRDQAKKRYTIQIFEGFIPKD